MEKGLENNNGLKVMLIIFILLSVILGGFILYDKVLKEDKDTKCEKEACNCNSRTNDDNVNTFTYNNGNSYGIAVVKGYAKVEAVDPSDIYVEDGPENAVYFYVTSTDSDELKKEIASWYFDGYTGEKRINLGCLNNNAIGYWVAADKFATDKSDFSTYIKSFTLDSDISNKILNSSVDNQISLKLEKYQLTSSGDELDTRCFSYFTNVTVLD